MRSVIARQRWSPRELTIMFKTSVYGVLAIFRAIRPLGI